jgi:hypothetical protein
MAAKKRQTFGKIVRERERAEKRARKQEKKEARKAAAAAALEAEAAGLSEPASPEDEPETGLTPPGEQRS